MRHNLNTAVLATALTSQVMFGADTPYKRDLHGLRPHKGSQIIAEALCELIKDSPIREFHRDFEVDGEVQDVYNLRCAAQILGPCWNLIQRAIETFEIEANSVTDNPIDISALDEKPTIEAITSGGHFHGMPVAVDAYGLIQAAAIAARLSNMRCARYVDPARNKGLGPQLKWPGDGSQNPERLDGSKTERELATESGLMIAEYTTAGLTNWIWGQSMPSHLMSISTDSGQEDHVSMASNVAMRSFEVADRLAEILAVELAFAAQAAAIRKERLELKTRPLSVSAEGDAPPPRRGQVGRPGDDPVGPDAGLRGDRRVPVETFETKSATWWRVMQPRDATLSTRCEQALRTIERQFPILKQDRYIAPELKELAVAVLDGSVASSAEVDVWF